MSLEVWLPLDGKVENRGLGDWTIASTNLKYETQDPNQVGSFRGSQVLVSWEDDSTTNGVSICFWMRQRSASQSWTNVLSFGSGLNRMEKDTTNTYHWYVSSSGTAWFDHNTTLGEFTPDIWYHIAFVGDGTNVNFYVNGQLKSQHTQRCSFLEALGTDKRISFGEGLPGNQQWIGYIRDIRIYTNALSPKEVKEISKGLILHYPLNTLPGENLVQASQINRESTLYGFETRSIPLEAGTTYTFSVNGRVSQEAKAAGTHLESYIYKPGWSWEATFPIYSTEDTTESMTFTVDETRNDYQITFYNYPSSVTTRKSVFVNWIKIEKGSIATPYVPSPYDSYSSSSGYNDSDLTVYDTSGYGHNAFRNGVVNGYIGDDCPRYKTAVQLGKGKIVQYLDNAPRPTENITIACWVKPAQFTGNDTQSIFGCWQGGGGGIFITSSGFCTVELFYNGSYHQAGATIPFGQWTHIALVKDLTSLRFYVNGELAATNTADGSYPITYNSKTPWAIGVNPNELTVPGTSISDDGGYYENGVISDLRMYSTALSETDIKELSTISAAIDNKGNMFTYELEEA